MAKIFGELRAFLSLRSLQKRIFLVVLVAGFVPSIIMRFGILENYEERSVQQRISTVQNQLMIVGNHLISNNYFNTKPQGYTSSVSRDVIDAELEMISNLYEGRVMIIDSSLKVLKDTYGISEGKTIISEEVIKCFQGQVTNNYDREHGYIEMTTSITDAGSDKGEIIAVMLTSISNESIAANLEVLGQKALILECLIIVVVVAMALVLSVVMTRPFNRITEAINEVKAGYRDEGISVQGYAETNHIVDAFNQLLKRMRVLDNSRQEFVENVSHELKTPMAAIKVLADSLLAQGDAPAELYQEFLEDIASEIDRENQIITDLLALVKMDKKAQELNIISLNVNDLVELILKRLRPLARK